MASLAQELLEDAASATAKSRSWLKRLSPDHRKAVEDARASWSQLPHGGGISATSLAGSIVSKMRSLGYDMPSVKQVQRWLTNRLT